MQAPAAKFRIRIAVLSVAALLLVGGLFFQPLVIRTAQSAARERGWTIEVSRVRLGVQGLWLKDIRGFRHSAPGFEMTLNAVLVPWNQLMSRGALVVNGGTLNLPEHLESLTDYLTLPSSDSSVIARHHKWQVHVSGLSANWSGTKSDNGTTWAWGVSGEITSDDIQLTVDRIEAAYGGLFSLFIGTAVELSHAPKHWELSKLKVDQARIELQSAGNSPAFTTPSSKPTHPVRAPVAGMPPRTGANISAAPRDAIERFVERLNAIQRYTQNLRESFSHRIATRAAIEIQQVSFRWSHGAQKLDIGPLQANAVHDTDQLKITLEQPGNHGDDRRYVELRIPTIPSQIELNSEIGFVSLQALGVKEGDFGLEHVDAAKLRLSVKSVIDEPTSTANVTATGEVLDSSLRQPWLASRPVEGIRGAFAGSGEVTWKPEYALRIREFSLRVGQARLDVTADVRRTSRETRVAIELSVPLAACEDLIESLPSGLAPLASQLRLDGTLSLQAGVSFDTAHPERTDAKWDLANGCRVRAVSPLISPERFRESFILEVPEANGVMTERAFGPGTASWVPLSAMTGQLANAVLVCEDGRFFQHNGFDSQAIRSSIRDNLLRGRFIRGGSTLSMQLAKNLYLRREKTFSRKLQEAALTLLLEQSFSKSEIMELYWNVVELGPGIYGVGEASRFYFGTTAAALSPAQAFYLASILPNPKVIHFGDDGKVSPAWQRQVRRLLTIAHARHYLSDEELRLALSEELRFGASGEGSQSAITVGPGTMDNASDDVREGLEHE